MRICVVSKFLGSFMAFISVWILVPLTYSIISGGDDAIPIAVAFAAGVAVSAFLTLCGLRSDLSAMRSREAMFSVTMAWIIASAVGAVPFYLQGCAMFYADAYFEAMSGFTTTGATMLLDIDSVPNGLLLWRALMHWLGGMGIIALTLTIMPIVGIGGFNLYAAEVPGFDKDRMTPRVRDTAMILWGIYIVLTAALAAVLMILGMGAFDAFTHAMSTISTGGFSPHNGSMEFFDSPVFDWVIIIFMYLSGINFALYFQFMRGRKFSPFAKDAEFVFYTKCLLVFSVLVTGDLYINGVFDTFADCLRHGVFQVVSFVTTTGFVSTNYDLWPQFSQSVLFLTLFMGACAGSTSGGFKQIRLLVIFRQAAREIRLLLDPKALLPVRVGNKAMEQDIISSTLAYLGMYLSVYSTGAFAASFFEPDFLTTIGAAASMLGNVGPAFRSLGASFTFSSQTEAAKWTYSFMMLCGRLELYTVLILFTSVFWSEGIIVREKKGDASWRS